MHIWTLQSCSDWGISSIGAGTVICASARPDTLAQRQDTTSVRYDETQASVVSQDRSPEPLRKTFGSGPVRSMTLEGSP